jgi:hypothetical protein
MSSNNEATKILTSEDLQHHNMARKYALNLIDSVLKHKENGAMASEIRDIAKQRYNLYGTENELRVA